MTALLPSIVVVSQTLIQNLKSFLKRRAMAVGGGARGARRGAFHVVGAGLGDEVRGAEQALEGARVRPPPVEFVPRHLAAVDVGVVHVRDLKLAAPRGDERLD